MKQVTSSIDLNEIEYKIKQIDENETRKERFIASQISNNEQYLAYGGNNGILKIYDIQQDKLVRQLALTYINTCFFSFDSSQLFVGLGSGQVYGYDVLKEFKQIFGKKIHQEEIFKMIIIKSQYLITGSFEETIKILISKIDDIIISGSWDKSIKLWKCKNRSIIINKQHLNAIMQLQLMDNNQNVLSFDLYGLLQKQKIDLIKRDLIKIKEFRDPNQICGFYQVNNGQNLLLICRQYFKILNDQGQVIHKQYHNATNFNPGNQDEQLDNLRYIHINSGSNIFSYNRKNYVGHCKDKMKYYKFTNQILKIKQLKQLKQ